jgi:uncharacterized membrane protein YgcG
MNVGAPIRNIYAPVWERWVHCQSLRKSNNRSCMCASAKRLAFIWSFCAAVAFVGGCADQQVHPETPGGPQGMESEASEQVDTDPSALAQFREPLEPYGHWVDDPTFGTVWVPSSAIVGSDFAPYVTAGHWALTDDDQWTWVSDYEWGWAPFHYGRWVWIDGTGWAWIPGGVYAPAWVVWETGDYDEPYVGWAPMPPVWCWRGGVVVRLGSVPRSRYVYLPSRQVFRPEWRSYVAADARVAAVAPHMQPYAAPGGARYAPMAMTRGPTPAAARIPGAALPAQRVTSAPRATSTGASHPASGGSHPSQRGAPSRGGGRSRGGGGRGGGGGGRR